jgi:hypothetical protein
MKTQTYAELKGKKSFDWNRFLNRAIRGEVGEKAIKNALERANSWVTCACGNQCSIIPRIKSRYFPSHGAPKDQFLADLGIDFNDAIESGQWHEAKDILKYIENRSAELIAKIKNAKP